MPDIEPQRMSATDVASLSPVEVYATLVHLAGHPDPVVTEALLDAVRRVLGQTRAGELRGPVRQLHLGRAGVILAQGGGDQPAVALPQAARHDPGIALGVVPYDDLPALPLATQDGPAAAERAG